MDGNVTGKRISTFTQADLASRNVQYVHTSEEEKHSDDFTFTVSDGANEVHTHTHIYTHVHAHPNEHQTYLNTHKLLKEINTKPEK